MSRFSQKELAFEILPDRNLDFPIHRDTTNSYSPSAIHQTVTAGETGGWIYESLKGAPLSRGKRRCATPSALQGGKQLKKLI
jgi:hypothetical protein